MKFRTEYIPRPSAIRLNPELPILLLGSCFSDNVGHELSEMGWDARVNPCGTIFNPASLLRIVSLAESGSSDVRTDETDGRHFSWDFPTTFTAPSREELLAATAASIRNLRESITAAQCAILTLGTSAVYTLDGEVVANCHRRPAALFVRKTLSVDECCRDVEATISMLRRMNPEIKVILTVSPVRHLRDGFEANTRQKARLLLCCEEMERSGLAEYFPAYEILTDDLRDYRFYADDLLHPSPAASAFIAGIFLQRYVDETGRKTLEEGAAIRRRLRHRIMNPDDPESARFLSSTSQLAADFRLRHPAMIL